ncbi:MAG: sigma-70 family RNA polymerase sigma factor [Prevotella sp.]|nr:sigma-70 family RNA polymerase sigma factor [Prevotella sp.]
MRRLYDRFSGYTMATALRYIPDREMAKDVVQDCFVSILTTIDGFEYRGEGSLRAWITRIVSNQAVDWVKRHEQHTFTDEIPQMADEEPPDVEAVSPDILNGMISHLPAGYRLVLNLHVFERLSHKEIAFRLGIKESTSASQFFHAKQLLAEMITRYLNARKI